MTNSSQKLRPGFGKGMALFAWLSAMVLLYLLFEYRINSDYNPNAEPELSLTEDGHTTVLLKRNRQGHYVASGTLNKKPAVFLLDTGATHVAIPAHMAKFFNLKSIGKQRVQTAAGVVTAHRALIKQMRIGGIELTHVKASLIPSMEGDTILLGMSALGRVAFSQKDGEMLLQKRVK